MATNNKTVNMRRAGKTPLALCVDDYDLGLSRAARALAASQPLTRGPAVIIDIERMLRDIDEAVAYATAVDTAWAMFCKEFPQ